MYSVGISTDGKYIVAGSREAGVYLFDKDSSTPLWNSSVECSVYAVPISADGEYIAVSSWDDGKLYLFGKDSSTPLWSYDAGDEAQSVGISADGEYIAAGAKDHDVYLFSKDSGIPHWNTGWGMGNNLSDADASFWGESGDDQSAFAVSSAGDVNGDGYDDFIIGAAGDDDGGSRAGQTYLILGKASGWSMDTDLSDADASFWGEDSNDRSGEAVSGAGAVSYTHLTLPTNREV